MRDRHGNSLLGAKLNVPKPRRGLVERPRLVESLSRGTDAKLTLISAPAGSGKTTLLADWAAGALSARSVGWLSLDPTDNEYSTFWTYVIAALETVAPEVGANSLSVLRDPQPGSAEVALTKLINELSAVPSDVWLVLDDYHLIDAREIQEGMAFFLEHVPRHFHLVIATRADPAFPLARLRAQAELVEIRARDLRFTKNEAEAYLNDTMDLGLTTHDVEVLEERTEGWIAALQLAALSIEGREDISAFIARFAGSERYIVDYLVEEVLQRQAEEVGSFLMETSILNRLTGSLCDAVTGRRGGKAMLESLERGNLFIVPLDDDRRWYRYHHLFADVLKARLTDDDATRVSDLHRRASAWYEQSGDRSEAIHHALAGEDFERAADLVELALPELRQRRQETTMRDWLDAIPDELFDTRPVLAIGYVGSRLVSGDLEGVETRLRQAERWLGTGDHPDTGTTNHPDDMVVRDEAAFRRLPGAISVYRTALARASGDADETIAQAHRTMEVIGDDDNLERGGAAGFLALAHWSRGELDDSYRWWTDAAKSLGRAGHVSDVLGCRIALADILIEQGRLRDAMSMYERGLELVSDHSGAVARGVADMHIGMAELFREWNDLAAAREHLQMGEELGDFAGLAQNAHRSSVAKAGVLEAEGDLDAAVELLDQAERLYASDYFPDVRPISALRARVWIRQGRLRQALEWAHDQGLSVEDNTSYLREFEHITLAQALLAAAKGGTADDRVPEVADLLNRLLAQAESGGRLGNVIEILILRAVADAGHDRPAALGSLEKAIELSESEGHVRAFTARGPAIVPMLKMVAERSLSDHSRLLLTAVDPARTKMPLQQGLVEPLTERELEVLRLLGTDLAGPEIARQLYVSLNTLRTHTKSIYLKLGVNSRRAAITRAVGLDLLPPSRH